MLKIALIAVIGLFVHETQATRSSRRKFNNIRAISQAKGSESNEYIDAVDLYLGSKMNDIRQFKQELTGCKGVSNNEEKAARLHQVRDEMLRSAEMMKQLGQGLMNQGSKGESRTFGNDQYLPQQRQMDHILQRVKTKGPQSNECINEEIKALDIQMIKLQNSKRQLTDCKNVYGKQRKVKLQKVRDNIRAIGEEAEGLEIGIYRISQLSK